MKKLFLSLIITLSFLLLLGTGEARAQSIVGPLVKSGESITFTDTVDGDVFLFGGSVNVVDAVINGDLIIIGGQVEVSGTVADDLRIIAGQAKVNALVQDNLSVVGGQVNLSKDSLINSSALIMSGNTRLNSQVLENVIIYSDSSSINSQANIGGNLEITYGSDPVISKEAIISGELTKQYSENLNFKSGSHKTFKKSKAVKKITTFVVFQQLATLALEVFVGWLLIALLPKLAKKLVETGLSQPGASIGWGLLVMLLAPTVGILLTITLIGIPLGVLTFILYGLSLYLARLIAAISIGHQLLKDKNLKKPYHSFLLGAVILFILKLIPAIGWLAYFIIILYGLGALTLVERKVLSKQKK